MNKIFICLGPEKLAVPPWRFSCSDCYRSFKTHASQPLPWGSEDG